MQRNGSVVELLYRGPTSKYIFMSVHVADYWQQAPFGLAFGGI